MTGMLQINDDSLPSYAGMFPCLCIWLRLQGKFGFVLIILVNMSYTYYPKKTYTHARTLTKALWIGWGSKKGLLERQDEIMLFELMCLIQKSTYLFKKGNERNHIMIVIIYFCLLKLLCMHIWMSCDYLLKYFYLCL